tara:strand:+ start:477 stop:638 length:162 start_codon:yes stop_codon:yes gene_type:complete
MGGIMVKYPKKFTLSALKKLSIAELNELEDALYYDRKRVLNVIAVKKMESEEE